MMHSIIKYPVIKSREQYNTYCSLLESLVFSEDKTVEIEEEIDLLTVLIEHWDREHTEEEEVDSITFLRVLMDTNHLRNKDLAKVLDVSPGLISDILNSKKGLSKENIWKLSEYFKVDQKVFNKPKKIKMEAIG